MRYFLKHFSKDYHDPIRELPDGSWYDIPDEKATSLEETNRPKPATVRKRAEYIQDVLRMAEFYAKQGKFYMRLHVLLQITTILGAVSLPILVNLFSLEKVVLTGISLLVAVGVAFSSWMKLGEHSALSYQAHWKFVKEYQQYQLGTELYKGFDGNKAFDHFVEQTQAIRAEAHHRTVSSSLYTNYPLQK